LDNRTVDPITQILLTADAVGLRVYMDDDSLLLVRGPRNHPYFDVLREHKTEIIEWFDKLEARLQRGQHWLTQTYDRMWDDDGMPVKVPDRTLELFFTHYDTWDTLNQFFEPGQCPIPEGCDEDSPVWCRQCGQQN
jgi:hypothetical protein